MIRSIGPRTSNLGWWSLLELLAMGQHWNCRSLGTTPGGLAVPQCNAEKRILQTAAVDSSTIPEHTLSPTCQLLGDLAGKGTHLLVLHEVFVHQVAETQANRQIEGEEGMWHWLSPQLLGNSLLVEDLSDWSVHDEHWES